MSVVFDLTGKTAVVTGGAQGIGRGVAEQLHRAGARVYVWDITPSDVAGTSSLTVDVTDGAQVAAAAELVVSESGTIDILVNNAGHLGRFGPFEELTPDEWQRILAVNLVGVLETCRAVVPHMRRAGGGCIVNMGSLAGKHGLANLSVYSAASAGVIAFTKALAKEHADTGIRVNAVAPGPIATELILRLGDEVVASMIEASPMKRLGTVDEVAGLVVWLCSDASSFSTGAVFDASGGRASY